MMRRRSWTLLGLTLGMLWLGSPQAGAHCDTLDGPVVQDARDALDRNDVTPVLKWVPARNEGEVRKAFQTALFARGQEAAYRHAEEHRFFETLVRLHRAGEGETFTGLKPAGMAEPGVAEADQAIQQGSVQPLLRSFLPLMFENGEKYFARVLEKRKRMNESVAAGREYVAAYVDYLHYIVRLKAALEGGGPHPKQGSEPGLEDH